MAKAKLPIDDQQFADEFSVLGAQGMARQYSVDVRNVFYRRRKAEEALGRTISVPAHLSRDKRPRQYVRQVLTVEKDMTILVGSDAHYEINTVTTAHLAFVELAKQLQPDVIVLNGDLLDGSSISRHAPLGWEERPTVQQELETVGQRLDEIEKASPSSRRHWVMGNHDSRFDMKLADALPQYKGVAGFSLREQFPAWIFSTSLWIEGAERPIMIRHKPIGAGITGGHRTTLMSGTHTVSGHTHHQEAKPFSDYTGTRLGIQLGTMAEPNQPTFDYTEDSPKNWSSGFAVLSIKNNYLLQPEFVRIHGYHEAGEYEWRGEIHRVEYE
jgi:predicted phosphodiesterase